MYFKLILIDLLRVLTDISRVCRDSNKSLDIFDEKLHPLSVSKRTAKMR